MTHRMDDLPSWLLSRAALRAESMRVLAFAKVGARPYHFRMLAALAEGGPMSQVELGRQTSLDRKDVAGGLVELEDRGYVLRERDSADARRNVVAVTKAGRKQLATLDRVVADLQGQLMAPLTESEERIFVRLLRKVAAG